MKRLQMKLTDHEKELISLYRKANEGNKITIYKKEGKTIIKVETIKVCFHDRKALDKHIEKEVK